MLRRRFAFMFWVWLVCLFSFETENAHAAVLDVPSSFPSIQCAIDSALDGDVIRVAPGIYFESIRVFGRAVTLESTGGADVTTIDASLEAHAIETGDGASLVLEGFTVTGAQVDATITTSLGGAIVARTGTIAIRKCVVEANLGNQLGGGISIFDADATLSNNVVFNNNVLCPGMFIPACGAGGGVYIEGSTAVIHDNQLVTNNAPREGGGMTLVDTVAEMTGNEFQSNGAAWGGGLSIRGSSDVTMVRQLIAGNVATGYPDILSAVGGLGGGIWIAEGAVVSIDQTTIADNLSLGLIGFGGSSRGGGVANESVSTSMRNSILWGNGSDADPQLHAPEAIEVAYATVEGGYSGSAAIPSVAVSAADPLFVVGATGGYSLAHVATGDPMDSPAVDGGDPNAPPRFGSTRVDSELDVGVLDQGFFRVPAHVPFRRGDGNDDGMTDVSDVIFVIQFVFGGGSAPTCLDSADSNDDGVVDVSDAVSTLMALFVSGVPPLLPPLDCGPDPTPDLQLDCAAYSSCSGI